MKEASGELSMTAVAVVAIAAIGVVFTTLVWPSIKATIVRNTKCNQTISCETATNSNQKTVQCTVCKDDDTGSCRETETIMCPVK